MNAEDLLYTALMNDARVFLHYTSGSGLAGILAAGTIRTDGKGYVYFTQEPFTPEQAHMNLFIGASTHEGRGTHIIALRLDSGIPLEDAGLYETRVRQSIRVDQHEMIYNGPNPFR